MAKKTQEYSGLIELGEQLAQDDIQKLSNFLNIPSGLRGKITTGTNLLNTLRKWEDHDPFMFYQGLGAFRPDLSGKAKQYTWLATDQPFEGTGIIQEVKLSVKSLVRLLKSELADLDWARIELIVPKVEDSMNFTAKMQILIKEGYIANDLTELMELMSVIKRNDVEQKVMNHHKVFQDIPNQQFIKRLEKEIGSIEKEIKKWEESLRKFIEVQNRQIKQMIIYVPLTIIKEKPRPVDLKDETTYNEIAYMRQIANKEIKIEPINFRRALRRYNPSTPEIWCVLGNPGSGKSFLCHRTALRFGKGELPRFLYCLSIPCRSADWHQMEKDRAGKSVNGDFIQKWLYLSMPVASNWSADLSKHIWESDGDKLLLIIDSMDEFTKENKCFLRTIMHIDNRFC